MLPSLLARDIRQGVKEFLVTGFEPSDPFFHGIVRRFVDDEAGWLRGPYVQLGLPFRSGRHGTGFFPAFATGHPGFAHQEIAWQRIASDRGAANTLIATGTGSGKTECFLYPLLDHCAREREAGRGGVKALVIYPMNALATDQAGRFAREVARSAAFKGLRVGLYVGGRRGATGKPADATMTMSATQVITDRDTLRRHPPDILLTNYKMLDYLLVRPKDRKLWSRNGPETLRYIVVDELHTFDGAQGTDLALLLRRLRARLGTPDRGVICVGTSATLGAATDTAPLREYARQVFGSPFDRDAVVTEDRFSVTEFLGDAPIEHVLQPRDDLADALDPARYHDAPAAIAAWFGVFFAGARAPADVADAAWRGTLGELLKRHLLFVNLLKLGKGPATSLAELEQQMLGPLPESARPHIARVLEALLALVAWARNPAATSAPLLTLRLQMWMRELRRLVANVAPDAAGVALRPAADLRANPDGLFLPLIQCGECHTTGWLSRLPSGSSKLDRKLEDIYNTWFAGRPDATRLYPGDGGSRPQVGGVPQHLCAGCGGIQATGGGCRACGQVELVPVYRVTATRSGMRGTVPFTWHDSTCIACGARDRQILLGARVATLGSQVVEHGWASPFNDDKKLIAFSDSVQDAAHRAGFFGARTYANTVRTALGKALAPLGKANMPWSEFLARFPRLWHGDGAPFAMAPARFVAEFIGPNMLWQRDWAVELQGRGALPAGSRLVERVDKRLAWQAVAEFTYLSHRGRNLDRIGLATLAVSVASIEEAGAALLPVLHEKLGLRGLDASALFPWLWGFLAHLRRRGAVMHPELAAYAGDGSVWRLAKQDGRNEWMPDLGPYSPRPVLLTLGSHRDFDKLSSARRPTWFDVWLAVTIGANAPLAPGLSTDIYLATIAMLERMGVLLRIHGRYGDAIALNPDHLLLHGDVRQLRSAQGRRRLTVPADVAERLRGMPCLDAPQDAYRSVEPAGGWLADRFVHGDLRRVIAAEHTGLLDRDQREALEGRFKATTAEPWYENLLSATPTLELGVDIGDLSSVLLCSVPPNQASFLQRVGRAGRRDGNALATTLADGASPHDLYFFASTQEMIAGEVTPPGIFLQAAEVLRRQLFAYCLDVWVASGVGDTALPDATSVALDAVDRADQTRFPYPFLDHVLRNEPDLLEGFLGLLGADLDDRVRARLAEYMQGNGDGDGLRVRLLKLFEELADERRQHRKRAEQIRTRIAVAKARPRDEATTHEIDQLDRERQKALELVREINQRELLNTLTDAGLIPNYAFPEAGIELKSVLWRRRASDEAGQHAYVTLGSIKYERPAASALSEFAPENRFYANQRRVEIDQINMGLARLEWWRLCPACHHMQDLERAADADAACPRCGDPMWSDQSQKRQLLRFRQALANSDDTKVRIDDSADDREPRFYVRQLLADFDPSAIKDAWRLSGTALPFGFEFIASATFRDVNFGEIARPGDRFKVADRDLDRPGFRLCRHCGKVQTPPRSADPEDAEQQHSFDCDKRDSKDPADIVDCLYLYREFSSEALRILVPYTRNGMDEEVIQSFMAALQLGLKKRFGGKVDHLRLATQDEPGVDGGPRRQFVLLYDSIPGGTGYLHQLLAQDARTLADILRLAHDAIAACPCNQEAGKDGCYRCVYQYRLGRAMELVSRDRARAVLAELLASVDAMERVSTISDIFINPHFDSPLEARFIESLRRLSGTSGLPPVRLVQEIVNGKSGFLLEIGTERYWIEPQVDLGPDAGVAVASCPDFVIFPAQGRTPRRPFAVFCDGWTYHRDTLRMDASKRTALVASGRFWVWSVTHEDVKAALEGNGGTDLESPLAGWGRHDGAAAPPAVARAEPGAFSRNAVAQLLAWLARAPGEHEDAAVAAMKRNAAWATFLMIPHPGTEEATALAAEMEALWATLPEWMQALPAPRTAAGNPAGSHPSVRYWWPASFGRGDTAHLLTPGLLLLDEDREPASDRHRTWREWIALYNTLQVLPGLNLATRKGVAENDCEALAPHVSRAPSADAPGNALAQAWAAAIEGATATVQAGMRVLADNGCPPPDEVGCEHADAAGCVDAEAELAWTTSRLVVLLDEQESYRSVWMSLGWTVVMAQDDWTEAVGAALASERKR